MIETNIEWCDSTINGSSGCDGCELWNKQRKSCYAGKTHEGRWAHSLAVTKPEFYSPRFDVVKMIPGRFFKAAAWNDLSGTDRPDKPWLNGLPRMIFVGDMGDFLSRNVTDEFLMNELFAAMESELGRRHFWLLLTKRPRRLAELSHRMQGGLPRNCMAMTTVTDQETADHRIPALLKVVCEWRGLSCEPLLGPVDLNHVRESLGEHSFQITSVIDHSINNQHGEIDWVIGGGESGNGDDPHMAPRPTYVNAFRSLRDQCIAAGVPFFFKQHGDWIPTGMRPDMTKQFPIGTCLARGVSVHDWGDGTSSLRVGKRKANHAGLGRLLDGREWNEMPAFAQGSGVAGLRSDFASAGVSSAVQ